MRAQRLIENGDAGAEHDRFGDIYASWTDTAAATRATLPFYVDAHAAAAGPGVDRGSEERYR